MAYSAHEAVRQIVGQCAARLALDDWEAELLECLLRVVKLLKLDEGKVEVLKERPITTYQRDQKCNH